jgi:hypothetical protein
VAARAGAVRKADPRRSEWDRCSVPQGLVARRDREGIFAAALCCPPLGRQQVLKEMPFAYPLALMSVHDRGAQG